MRCEEVQEQLAAFVDGELPAADAEAVSVHLEGCLACQVDQVAMRQARESVAALPRAKAPEALRAGVAARIAAPANHLAAHHPPAHHPSEGLSAFLDDELPPAESDSVREHIAACGECAQALVTLDDLVGRVRTLPRKSAPSELVGRVLEKIGPQVITPATSPAAPPRSAPITRLARPDGKPLELGPGVKRFLAAASFLVFAISTISFATPNTSAQVADVGWIVTYPKDGRPIASRPDKPKPTKPTIDPDSLYDVSCESLESGAVALQTRAQAAGVAATPVPNVTATWALTGPAAALRRVLARKGSELQIEDAARFDENVPPARDKVYLRSGEVLGGTAQETATGVVLAARASADALPDAGVLGAGEGLRAEYFALRQTPPTVADAFASVGPRPALVAQEATLDDETPGAGSGAGHGFAGSWRRLERFAVRWSGYFAAEQSGTYTFKIGSDDGSELTLEGGGSSSNDGNHAYGESEVAMDLTRGLHALEVLYFNGGGPGACRLFVAAPGQSLEVVPQRLLYTAERVERAGGAVTLALPRRSVVKVVHPSPEPITIHVVLKKRDG